MSFTFHLLKKLKEISDNVSNNASPPPHQQQQYYQQYNSTQSSPPYASSSQFQYPPPPPRPQYTQDTQYFSPSACSQYGQIVSNQSAPAATSPPPLPYRPTPSPQPVTPNALVPQVPQYLQPFSPPAQRPHSPQLQVSSQPMYHSRAPSPRHSPAPVASPPTQLDAEKFLRRQELPKVRKILSLDGGGVRGLSIIMILKYIMRNLNRARGVPLEPWQEFDMICGTSTGG